MQRCVAGSAARVRRRIFDFQRLGDLFRARGGERGWRPLRMKIFQRPDEKLILFRTPAAVTDGTSAGIRAEKFRRGFRAERRAEREKNSGDKARGLATICFTHSVKLVNGVTL